MKKENERNSSVNVDSGLVAKALERAKKRNLPHTLIGLLGYLLNQFNFDLMNVSFDSEKFNWTADKRTSIVYDKSLMSSVKEKIKKVFLPDNNDFIVNFLLTNFLKNTE